jgi:osmotically-inducible protein OsmY
MKLTKIAWCGLLCAGLTTATVTTFTGCAGDRNNRSTGEYIDDKSLVMRVHDALHDNAEYKFANVDVNVYRGTVQLSGFVNSSDQKSKAVEIAKNVQGVKDVVNNITLKENQ